MLQNEGEAGHWTGEVEMAVASAATDDVPGLIVKLFDVETGAVVLADLTEDPIAREKTKDAVLAEK